MSKPLRFAVHLQPRASRDEIVGTHGDALKVRVTAPPVDSAANQALLELLADQLGVPRSALRIVAGHSSRRKIVEADGVSATALERLAKGDQRR